MAELIRVINNDTGSVSYVTPKVVRTFSIKGAYKDVTLEELQDALNENGARYLFEEGLLLIKNPKARDDLGLSELDEYIKDTQELELLLQGNKDDLVDFLRYCTKSMLDKIIDVAIETKDVKMDYIVLIEKYSGKEVSSAIVERANSQPAEKTARKIVTGSEEKEGRVPRG